MGFVMFVVLVVGFLIWMFVVWFGWKMWSFGVVDVEY